MKISVLVIVLSGVLATSAAAWILTRPLEKSIDAKVFPQHPSCSEPELPIAVVLKNQSYSTVTRVTFDVGTKRRGYSSALTNEKHPTDKIISPDEEVVWCVRRPTTIWINGAEFPGHDSDVPEKEIEYFVDIVAADAD